MQLVGGGNHRAAHHIAVPVPLAPRLEQHPGCWEVAHPAAAVRPAAGALHRLAR